MNLARLDLSDLDPHERAVFHRAVKGLANGDDTILRRLLEADYDEYPVSIDRFLDDPEYFAVLGQSLYPKWREELRIVCDPKNKIYEWIIEGGIGSGKTFAAQIAMAYKLYCLMCLRKPQTMYELGVNTVIYVAMFNITLALAKKVDYTQFKNMLVTSPWFQAKMLKPPREETRAWADVSKVILPKNLDFALGSNFSHALGQAVYGGILDEANFGKHEGQSQSDDVTKKKQIYEMYNQVRARLDSRFAGKPGPMGLLCLVSSKQDETSFLEQHKESKKNDPHTYVSSYPIWEVRDTWKGQPTFWVMSGDFNHRPAILDGKPAPDAPIHGVLVEVPEYFREHFERDIHIALRDLAGVATYGSFPFFQNREAVTWCVDTDRPHPFGNETVYLSLEDKTAKMGGPLVASLDRQALTVIRNEVRKLWEPLHHPTMPRYIHIDLAKNGDAAGICMACPTGLVTATRKDAGGLDYQTRDHHIFVDFTLQIKNVKGSEIDFSQIADFCEYLRRIGFNIVSITYDSFQSAHSLQILHKAGFRVGQTSVDKTSQAYSMLRSAIYERRIKYPRHSILLDELVRLQYDPKEDKIDHPDNFHKDVGDGLAGAVFDIMTEKESIYPLPVLPPGTTSRTLPPEAQILLEVAPERIIHTPFAEFFKEPGT